MNKSLLNLTFMALLATASNAALATDVTGLTTFTSGTPAVAAEVNDNFTAVKTAVDDNDGRITTNATAIATKADATAVTTEIAAAITTKADATAVTTEIAAAVAPKANSADVTTAIAAAVAPKANSADVTTEIAAAVAPKANSADVTTEIAAAVAPKADTTAVTANDADITALQQNGNPTGVACAGNDASDIMVRVGPLCVDKYEASVWSTASGGTQYGDGADDYPCADNGNDCTAIYARSDSNGSIKPSTDISWFQAQQACAASGKRLLTNAEWQMAAAGTTDPGAAGLGTTECNTNSGGILPTGNSGANCESNWGAADMVGNVWEWVADWVQGQDVDPGSQNSEAGPLPITDDDISGLSNNDGTGAGASYGTDAISNTTPAVAQGAGSKNMLAAMERGGRHTGNGGLAAGVFALTASSAPSGQDPGTGFRCAR